MKVAEKCVITGASTTIPKRIESSGDELDNPWLEKQSAYIILIGIKLFHHVPDEGVIERHPRYMA